MRRQRNGGGTKVWHNPELETSRRLPATRGENVTHVESDRKQMSQHRAALEALFSPRKEPEPAAVAKPAQRIVLAPPPQADPRTAERQKLLGKLLVAEGRPGISKAANEFLRAGFTFPDEQDVHLQLLEHSDEDHVRSAIDALAALLAAERPKRKTVLDSRLRRIEQFAEDAATRAAAERLRRSVSGGFGSTASGE
jgi:hypothetical protein